MTFEGGTRTSSGGVLNAPVEIRTTKPKRARGLFVVPASFTPREGVPSECPTTRMCEYVECPMHLWRVDPADREGRKDQGKGRGVRITYLAHSAATCTLDVANRGEHSARQVGKCMGLSTRRVEQITKGVMRKLKQNQLAQQLDHEAGEAPVSTDDWSARWK